MGAGSLGCVESTLTCSMVITLADTANCLLLCVVWWWSQDGGGNEQIICHSRLGQHHLLHVTAVGSLGHMPAILIYHVCVPTD